ncbi:MAG: thermonuclease family protein [Spirochaetaceae bacterium]|jgi:micrococcal nuclease|nr:thermonuclease family protein [Spirochaetaceae bacterium]
MRKTAASCLFLFLALVSCFAADSADPATIVYTTNSGTRYHREGCSSLSRSKIAISLVDATVSGLTPCLSCKPPVLQEKEKYLERYQGDIYRVHLANLKSYRDADTSKMLVATVIRHVDGDTVRLEFENPITPVNKIETIRMIGVDTPETVDPRKSVQFFGKEASDWTKTALLGKKVFVALDWDTRDKYKRLLVYIYTAPGECHNARLISEGYGHAYVPFPFQFLDEFRALERDARTAKRGLWAEQAH